ncbi:MAG: TIGR01841 family phasin [Steroidobacterales bacterium]
MAARSRSAKKKTASSRKKSTRSRKTSARPTGGISVGDITAALRRLKLSDAANVLIEGRRKDLEALVQANRTAYEGLQALVKRRTELLKDAIGEWQSVARMVNVAGPAASLAKAQELAKGTFQTSLENIRELAELMATSQAAAFEIVRERIRENVEEVRELLKSG